VKRQDAKSMMKGTPPSKILMAWQWTSEALSNK
jgi:hypothetical protein